MMKKTIVLLAALMTALLLLTPAYAADTGFSDVADNSYCAGAVDALSREGILNGYSDGTFRPGGTITRAEMAAVLCRMAKLSVSSTSTPFRDVPSNNWAAKYIAAAYQAGYIRGSSGLFRPNDAVSYNEAVKMVVCAAGLGEGIPSSGSNWAAGFLSAAKEHGITDGLSGQTAVRGNVAVMVYNAMYRPDKDIAVGMWRGSGKVSKSYTVTHNGAYSYRLADDTPNDIWMSKSYDVQPGRYYLMTAYIKTVDLQNHEKGEWGANVSASGVTMRNETWFGDTGWTKVTRLLCSDSGKANVVFRFGHNSNTCTGEMYVSDITVEECVPAESTEWKFLFVIFKNNDFTANDSEGKSVYDNRSMDQKEIDTLTNAIHAFERDMPILSNGKIKANVDIMVSNTPINHLSETEGDAWLSHDDAYELLKDQVNVDSYDHITAIADLGSLKLSYWGLGGTYMNQGTGYSFVKAADSNLWAMEQRWAPAIYVHELLHFASTWAQRLGQEMPVHLHDAEQYKYVSDPVDDYKIWYTDFMNCDVSLSGGGKGGVPSIAWAIPPRICRG